MWACTELLRGVLADEEAVEPKERVLQPRLRSRGMDATVQCVWRDTTGRACVQRKAEDCQPR